MICKSPSNFLSNLAYHSHATQTALGISSRHFVNSGLRVTIRWLLCDELVFGRFLFPQFILACCQISVNNLLLWTVVNNRLASLVWWSVVSNTTAMLMLRVVQHATSIYYKRRKWLTGLTALLVCSHAFDHVVFFFGVNVCIFVFTLLTERSEVLNFFVFLSVCLSLTRDKRQDSRICSKLRSNSMRKCYDIDI